MTFRDLLCLASGFQSLQFRLENKLGMKPEFKVKYYLKIFGQDPKAIEAIKWPIL